MTQSRKNYLKLKSIRDDPTKIKVAQFKDLDHSDHFPGSDQRSRSTRSKDRKLWKN